MQPDPTKSGTKTSQKSQNTYTKKFSPNPEATGALTQKIWILIIFKPSPGLIYYKDIEKNESPAAENGCHFVQKQEGALIICRTIFDNKKLNGGCQVFCS